MILQQRRNTELTATKEEERKTETPAVDNVVRRFRLVFEGKGGEEVRIPVTDHGSREPGHRQEGREYKPERIRKVTLVSSQDIDIALCVQLIRSLHELGCRTTEHNLRQDNEVEFYVITNGVMSGTLEDSIIRYFASEEIGAVIAREDDPVQIAS